jgi:hypothetical protein
MARFPVSPSVLRFLFGPILRNDNVGFIDLYRLVCFRLPCELPGSIGNL